MIKEKALLLVLLCYIKAESEVLVHYSGSIVF